MKIIAIERETGDGKKPDSSLLNAEAKHVWELHKSGVIREIYFRSDRREAVLILECSHVEEASSILSTLPLVKMGSIRFELIPLSAYTGFARLFGDGNLGAEHGSTDVDGE